MVQNSLCKGCQQKNACEDAYRRLGHSNAPPVTTNVLVAFVAPLLTFVLALAAAQMVRVDWAHPTVILLMRFVVALAATALVAAGGAWWMRSSPTKQQEMRQND